MKFDDDENCVGGLVPKFGAIFVSNGATKRECFKRKLFGLPSSMANFVKQVKSGMLLFLFEYEKKELYGVFQATSDGTMNLKPHAFTSSGKHFPAQVQVAPIWSCSPLPEVEFRDAIENNYFSPNKFHFGLSEKQVRVLLQLFYPRRLNSRMPPRQIDDEMTRDTGNKRSKTGDKIMVTGTSKQETGDCTESPYLSNFSEDSFGRAERVSDDGFFMGDKLEGKANFGRGHDVGINSPDVYWTKKRKMNSDGRFLSRDASEIKVHDNCLPWHVTGGDCIGDTLGTINSAADSTFLLNSRFSTEHSGNSFVGSVGADRVPLMMEERFNNDQNIGEAIEPGILPVFARYSTLSEDNIADDFLFRKDDRFENACDVENCIRPDFSSDVTKAFRRSEQNLLRNSIQSSRSEHLSNLIKPNLELDRFTLHDQLENVSACHLPNISKSFTQPSLVPNYAPSRTVPYDPDFPDLKYQCSSQMLDSAQDLSSDIVDSAQDLYSHQVHDENFLPFSTSECVRHNSTSECVRHKAALGSLYSEAPSVKGSVFSRLSVATRKHKKEDENGMHDKYDRLASIDEIMDSLHQAHNRWEKCKPSVGAKSRYVYIRCKEVSKCPNQLQLEQPVGTKEMTVDVNRFVEEDSDIVLKETRVVDFKRRSTKNKNMNEMVTLVSTGTNMGMTSKTSVDATGKDLVGKAGKSRKLIRPDFRKKECPAESCDISDMRAKKTQSTTSEDSTFLEETAKGIVSTNSKRMCVASSIHQDGKELLQDKIANEISQVPPSDQNVKNFLVIENQVKSSIQDLVSTLTSCPIQDSPTEVTVALGKFEGKEENEEMNYQGGSGANNLKQRSSLQNDLGSENQVNMSVQDLVSSPTSGSSAQEQPSFSAEVASVPKNLEEEETVEMNYQVGNGDISLE